MLVHYSFAYEGNKFDFCELLMLVKPNSLDADALVCLDNNETEGVQEVRLKMD